MKRKTVICLIIASLLIVSGAFISAMALSSINWDFGKLSTVHLETNRHEIIEDFSNISITADIEDIRFIHTTETSASIVFLEEEKQKHSATVSNGTLNISFNDTREWYEKIGIFSTKIPSITLYLPKTAYESVTVHTYTSDILLPKEFTFQNVEIKNSTGDVECYAASTELIKIGTSTGDIEMTNTTAGALELSTSTGDIEIENINCTGDIKIGVSTGETELSNVTCNNLSSRGSTGDIELQNVIAQNTFNITRSTGDVGLDACDAAEIIIVTDTGDVSGYLLTEKIYITDSDTGRINVPKTTSGGKCHITTDTGNIKFATHK